MSRVKPKKSLKRLIIIFSSVLLFFLAVLMLFSEFYITPALQKRLQTLIVDGSDSLYKYKLGSMKASLLGGNIEVNNLEIEVDSNRYNLLKSQHQLPALVVQLNVQKARIKGIGILALLFSKKIFITEISSSQADVKIYRFPNVNDTTVAATREPLWKAIRSKIKEVEINAIKLDGISLLYKNAEGSEAAKLQFDRCDADFKNIRIDSAAVADTNRISYVESFALKLNGLKYRTPDSTYKMKADVITYNSIDRLLVVDSFKLQPTLKKEERVDSVRKSWYTLSFDRVFFSGLRLDRYLRLNRAEADSAVFQSPSLSIYQDKRGVKSFKNQIGSYPHQKLLGADAVIAMKKFITHNMRVEIVEREEDTGQEGRIDITDVEMKVANIVNDPKLIAQNPVATADVSGKIIGSPVQALFRFYLDSANGKFEVKGNLKNVSAAQINPVSSVLANVEIPSAQIDAINFLIRGEDFGATADVQMKYSNLSVVFMKRDKETGVNETRKFLTNLLNKFAIYTSNPGSGTERQALGVKVARLTTQSFFGLIWQAVFAGMQNIILKVT